MNFNLSELDSLDHFESDLQENQFTTYKYSSKGYKKIVYKGPDIIPDLHMKFKLHEWLNTTLPWIGLTKDLDNMLSKEELAWKS